ncbi:glutaminase [Mergibacter septicus]|uniref:hypothetical protein n=1 Tax=Mergibacter septicus TaxID=221402 RepID=UPI00223EDD4F|nr:hypothetical protein [Mergibacter septicus]
MPMLNLQKVVDTIYHQYATAHGGENASYTPYLTKVPSELAVSTIVTVKGGIYSAGNMFCDPMEPCEVYTCQCSTLS